MTCNCTVNTFLSSLQYILTLSYTFVSLPFSGVPDCAHASPSLPRGQQHDYTAPLFRWNLPLLGLVPSQSEREDAERPLCFYGCLSLVCEYHITRLNTVVSDGLGFYISIVLFLCFVHCADTDRAVCCRHLAREGYSCSQGR